MGLLRTAIEREPESVELRATLARLLNKIALKEYGEGNYIKAKTFLKEAVELTNERAYLENLANVQLKLKDLKGAAASLEASTPVDEGVKNLLKNLYVDLANREYKAGNPSGAVTYLEKASVLAPADPAVWSSLEKLRADREVEKRMGVNEGGHFTIRFEGGENAETGYVIGLLLEEAYIKVGADLGYYPDDRIEALLFSRETFRDVTMSPSWAGAIFDGRIKIPAGGVTSKTSVLENVIIHEYTHAVVHRLSDGRAPVWLNEGLAQYEEGLSAGAQGEAVRELSKAVSLKALEGSFLGLDSRGASAAYLMSLSATEYIIKEFGIFSVKNILERLGAGQSLDEAVAATLSLSYDQMEKSWKGSVAR